MWILVFLSIGAGVYFWNQYRIEQNKSANGTNKNFTGGRTNEPITMGELIDGVK